MFLMPFLFLIFYSGCEASKKNVIFIVADDLGWSDIGYANEAVYSPNIDRLAKSGVILDQAYAYSQCTPWRTFKKHSVIFPQQAIGLPVSFNLMPEFFKNFGFKTHLVGKWHLGFCNKKFTPTERGFDTFFGFLNAQNDYYSHRVSASLVLKFNEGLDYWNQTKDYLEPVLDKNQTYSTFTYAERVIDILDKHDKKSPFFIMFSSQNCHSPNEAPQEYLDRYKFIEDEKRRAYLAMVSVLDDAIGKISKKLEDLGMMENTLIAFTSDNGGPIYSSARNFPLRGGKFTPFEGGHRVRAFIKAPGLQPYANTGMFHAVDWLPTVLNAAIETPIELRGIDGMNHWPSISQKKATNRTSFIYHIDPYGQMGCLLHKTEAIRDGDWKLIKGCTGIWDKNYDLPQYDEYFVDHYHEIVAQFPEVLMKDVYTAKKRKGVHLFNIKDDPNEKVDLSKKYKDKVLEMEFKLQELKKDNVMPLNPPWLLPDTRSDPKRWGDKWSPGWC